MSMLAAPVVVDSPRLRLSSTSDPDSGLVEQFYAGFDQAFVLPNEKESLDGIRQCLSLNWGVDGERLAAQWGHVREHVAIAEYRERIVGGANFIVFATEPHENGTTSRFVLVHLNYVYVLQESRGAGFLREIVNGVSLTASIFARSKKSRLRGKVGGWLFGSGSLPQPLIFIEQNDPYRLSVEDYAADTTKAGIDQFARIAIWSTLGARVVDFDYTQPPLSTHQEPDTNLVLAVMGVSQPWLPAPLLKAHLERFFAISVLKGNDPRSAPSAINQLIALEKACAAHDRIALLTLPKDQLLAAGAARAKGIDAGYENLRAFLRALRTPV